MTGAVAQLRALLALRWQMVHTRRLRLTVVLTALLLLGLLTALGRSAGAVDAVALQTAVRLAPAAFLGFGVLAVIAPLTAGGGIEVVPSAQLVAFPVRPGTQFLGGLALAPVNLVWVVQLMVLVAETSLLTAGGDPLLGALTTTAYVGSLTVLGQALAWLVVGLRQTRLGRRAVAGAAATLLLAALVLIRTGTGAAALEHGPTRTVVKGVAAGRDHLLRWGVTTGVLLLLLLAGLALGARLCGWALRRPGDAHGPSCSPQVRRRADPRSPLRALLAVDRASAWRAPALRRGALVLAVLPATVAAGARVPWESLVVLPGLVAAGAGLLFGVNAFCLDAGGAVWLASLPHDPVLVARSKALVLTETVLAAVAVAAVAGSLRSPGHPTLAELVAIVVSGLTCTAVVVAAGMAGSVRRPHFAALNGPRDAVAPPGALALASVRLALPAAAVGIGLEGLSQTGRPWLPALVALPLLLLALLWLRRSLSRYAQPARRARIVQVVSAG